MGKAKEHAAGIRNPPPSPGGRPSPPVEKRPGMCPTEKGHQSLCSGRYALGHRDPYDSNPSPPPLLLSGASTGLAHTKCVRAWGHFPTLSSTETPRGKRFFGAGWGPQFRRDPLVMRSINFKKFPSKGCRPGLRSFKRMSTISSGRPLRVARITLWRKKRQPVSFIQPLDGVDIVLCGEKNTHISGIA